MSSSARFLGLSNLDPFFPPLCHVYNDTDENKQLKSGV